MSLIKKYKERVKSHGRKYVWSLIIRNKVFVPVDHLLEVTIGKFFCVFPLRDAIVLESHNDFDSNGGAFYEYLIENSYNKRYKIIWVLVNKKPNNLPDNVVCVPKWRPSIRKWYYLATSRYILSCHLILGSMRKGQKSYYLTHGPVGLKAFKGLVILPKELDYVLTPSDYLKEILAAQYQMEYPNSKQVILGYPSHDYFYWDICGDLNKITQNQYAKVIMWMPTFRKTSDLSRCDTFNDKISGVGIPLIDDMQAYDDLNFFLKNMNSLLIIKIHPMQDLANIRISNRSNILVLTANDMKKQDLDNYKLLKDIDALISDYSSVAYDFLHLNKPIAYTMDDLKNYKCGLILEDPDNLLAGPVLNDMQDLYGFLEDVIESKDGYSEKRRAVFERSFKYHDGNSCLRLAEHMGLK